MLKFRGIYCPLVTPFDHKGELYLSKLRHNVSRLNQTKLSGYVVGGRAGEGPLMQFTERVAAFGEVQAEAADGRMLIADVSAPSVHESVLLAGAAAEAGYDCVYVVASQVSGSERLYVSTVADRSPLPVVAESGVNHPKIAAVCSASSGEVSAPVLTNRQGSLVDDFTAGAVAAIVELANAVPFFVLSIEEAIRTREIDAARDLESLFAGLVSAVEDAGVGGLKHAADLRGYYGGLPRLPLEAPKPKAQERIAKALDGIAS